MRTIYFSAVRTILAYGPDLNPTQDIWTFELFPKSRRTTCKCERSVIPFFVKHYNIPQRPFSKILKISVAWKHWLDKRSNYFWIKFMANDSSPCKLLLSIPTWVFLGEGIKCSKSSKIVSDLRYLVRLVKISLEQLNMELKTKIWIITTVIWSSVAT